jgi:MoxR-like ATPase
VREIGCTNTPVLAAGQAKQLISALLASPTAPPMMLWGPPGVGKSSIVRQAAREAGLTVLEVRAAYRNPVDILGLPVADHGSRTATWFAAGCWPREEQDGPEGVLFLDEITNAPRITQGALYELILDKRIEDYRLPEGWRIVAAGNRVEDRAAANPMPSALANRLLHIVVQPNADDWVAWAWQAGIRHEIIAYLKWRPENLLVLPAAGSDSPAFPSPRSWEMASRVWTLARDRATRLQLVAAAVGLAAAAEVTEFAEAAVELPDPEEVLNGGRPKPPAKTDRLYLFTTALVAALKRDPNASRVAAFARYVVGMLKPEFQVLALRGAAADLRIRPLLVKSPDFVNWVQEHREELLEVLEEETNASARRAAV